MCGKIGRLRQALTNRVLPGMLHSPGHVHPFAGTQRFQVEQTGLPTWSWMPQAHRQHGASGLENGASLFAAAGLMAF